jgi:raffinose/stachyose/melibiose transport system permease protein
MTIQPSLRKRAFGKLVPYLFIAPAFFFFAVFVLVPILATLRLSFFEWSGFSAARFIGIENYRNLFADKVFWLALQNNFKFVVFYTVLPIVLGLLLTMLIGRRNFWGAASLG